MSVWVLANTNLQFLRCPVLIFPVLVYLEYEDKVGQGCCFQPYVSVESKPYFAFLIFTDLFNQSKSSCSVLPVLINQSLLVPFFPSSLVKLFFFVPRFFFDQSLSPPCIYPVPWMDPIFPLYSKRSSSSSSSNSGGSSSSGGGGGSSSSRRSRVVVVVKEVE